MLSFWNRVYKTLDTKPENVDITGATFCCKSTDGYFYTACIIRYRLNETQSRFVGKSQEMALTVYQEQKGASVKTSALSMLYLLCKLIFPPCKGMLHTC